MTLSEQPQIHRFTSPLLPFETYFRSSTHGQQEASGSPTLHTSPTFSFCGEEEALNPQREATALESSNKIIILIMNGPSKNGEGFS